MGDKETTNLNVKIVNNLYIQIKTIQKIENLKLPQIVEDSIRLYLEKYYKEKDCGYNVDNVDKEELWLKFI